MTPGALAQAVEQAMRGTRETVLTAFGAQPDPRFKADGSTVTDLDHLLERTLADALMAIDPSFGVVGEESGRIRDGTPTWYLDPVDGTANFARRSPLFASQVVLMDGLEPRFAAVYEPLRDDFTWAAAGAGAWRQGRRLQVEDREPRRAVVYADVSDSGLFVSRPTLVRRLRASFYKLRLLGSIALHLRDVAAGVADGYVAGRGRVTALHDLAPGLLLCREAGASDSDGAGGDPLVRRDTLVVGTPRVHDRICEILRETP